MESLASSRISCPQRPLDIGSRHVSLWLSLAAVWLSTYKSHIEQDANNKLAEDTWGLHRCKRRFLLISGLRLQYEIGAWELPVLTRATIKSQVRATGRWFWPGSLITGITSHSTFLTTTWRKQKILGILNKFPLGFKDYEGERRFRGG
jgi:hypothetical protein